MDAKRLTPNKIANLVMAEDAWHDSEYVAAADYDAALARAEKAEAEVERLRADAERYRWLRAEMDADIAVVSGFGVADSGSTGVVSTYAEALFFEKLDAAIDAARGES